MALFCLRHFEPAKQEYETLIVETEKPLRRLICMIEEKASSDVSDEEVTIIDFQDSFPRFGPAYRKDPDPFRHAKEEAWRHILKKSEEEDLQVRARYLDEIKILGRDARDSYADSIINRLKKFCWTPSDFNWMMIIDGCFFLQLALHILGGTELLDYPEKHLCFGLNIEKAVTQRIILAMFFVGNQIPCIVIRKLMKQPFFRGVIERGIAKGTWKLPSDLPRMALYLSVVQPELKARGITSSSGFFSKLIVNQERIPYNLLDNYSYNDVLECLYYLVLGPGNAQTEPEYIAFDHVVDIDDPDPDRNKRFPSATELVEKGVTLKRAKGGIRNIRFKKKFLYQGYLYVPPFIFDAEQEAIFHHLISYETAQKMTNHEVTVYLRFLKDFIRSKDDAKLLESKGIIEAKTKTQKDRLSSMITKSQPSKEIAFTESYRLARLHAANFSHSPWVFRGFIFFLFTMIPNIFTVLSYVFPRK